MFSIILLICGTYWAWQMKPLYSKIVTNSALVFAILFIILFSIYALQTLTYSPSENKGFFSLMSSDGVRYLQEAQLFTSPWNLNELQGRYETDTAYYEATPKMGLSGFISVLTIGWTPGINTAYGLLLLAVLIGGYIKIRIIDCFKISPIKKLLMAIVIVLFPTDIYFSFRFLREPVANDMFVIGFLLIGLHHFEGRHSATLIKLLPFTIAVLILWRVQLAFVLSISCLLLLPLNRRSIAIITPLIILSLLQMVRATSVLTMAVQFNSDLAYQFFSVVISSQEFLSKFDAFLFIAPLLFSIITPLNFQQRKISKWRFQIISVGIIIPWLLADIGQLRFLYPAIIWLKCALIMLAVHPKQKLVFKKKVARYRAPIRAAHQTKSFNSPSHKNL